MVKQIIRGALIILVILILWRLAGGSIEGVVDMAEAVVRTVFDALVKFANAMADIITNVLGGGSSEEAAAESTS
jgi:hypothetical protein